MLLSMVLARASVMNSHGIPLWALGMVRQFCFLAMVPEHSPDLRNRHRFRSPGLRGHLVLCFYLWGSFRSTLSRGASLATYSSVIFIFIVCSGLITQSLQLGWW
jgi:hypothetical protein